MSNTSTTLRVMKQVSSQDVDAVDAGRAHYLKIVEDYRELKVELARVLSDNRGLRVYIDELESMIRENGVLR